MKQEFKILAALLIFLTCMSFIDDDVNKASWYGEKFHGKVTANGEIYNQNDLTAASPTIAFNTMLRVTNLDNNKHVIVRINDRGPYKMYKDGKVIKPLIPHPNRVLDLSKKAFSKIANVNKGIIKIRYKIIR